MTCKDCIHYNVCVIVEHRVDEDEDHLSEFGCKDFINKNDVVEVVHGCWLSVDEYGQKIGIDTEGYLNNWVFCSNCEHQMRFAGWSYCPNCGAKMGGKKVE